MKKIGRYAAASLIVVLAGCTTATYPGDLLRFGVKSAPLAAVDPKTLIPAAIGVQEESAVQLLTPEDRRVLAAVRLAEKEFDLHPLWWTAEDGGLVYESYRYGESHPYVGQICLAVDWRRRTIQVYENGGSEKSKNEKTKAFVSLLEQRIRESDSDATVTREDTSVRIRTGGFK